jgi:Citrate lyase, alpha subunit
MVKRSLAIPIKTDYIPDRKKVGSGRVPGPAIYKAPEKDGLTPSFPHKFQGTSSVFSMLLRV